MKQKITAGILALLLAVSLAACSQAPKEAPAPYEDMVITKEQMLEDYDAMWSSIGENYPFLGVIERRDGPGAYERTISEYRREMEEMALEGDAAMFDFLRIIAYSLADVCQDPHVSILNPNFYRYCKEAFAGTDSPRWNEVLAKPQVADLYEYYDYLIDFLVTESPQTEDVQEQSQENALSLEILEEGKTAYIRTDSFDDNLIAENVPTILAFLDEVSEYEHLIIDIQNNGGGSSLYWEDAFVRPNLTEPVVESYVRLMNNGELACEFYGSQYEDASLTVEDVRNTPAFTALNRKDMDQLILARKLSFTMEPTTGERLFQGEIWVLVGPHVYSAAESFAQFCKATQFATLVGATTGGGNTGGPILYELPNSHTLVQFDVEYCLNPDGSCTQETGTAPDVVSDNPLQTVLELIDAEA